MRKSLERSGVRIKGICAVTFREVAKVAEIVVGQFVEQLRHAYRPYFVVAAGASGGRGGNGVQEDNVGAAQGNEMFQMLTSGFPLKLSRAANGVSAWSGFVAKMTFTPRSTGLATCHCLLI